MSKYDPPSFREAYSLRKKAPQPLTGAFSSSEDDDDEEEEEEEILPSPSLTHYSRAPPAPNKNTIRSIREIKQQNQTKNQNQFKNRDRSRIHNYVPAEQSVLPKPKRKRPKHKSVPTVSKSSRIKEPQRVTRSQSRSKPNTKTNTRSKSQPQSKSKTQTKTNSKSKPKSKSKSRSKSKSKRKQRTTAHDDVYEVEDIRDKRIRNRSEQYLVKWQGYDEWENTWETIENLGACISMVKRFNKKYKELINRRQIINRDYSRLLRFCAEHLVITYNRCDNARLDSASVRNLNSYSSATIRAITLQHLQTFMRLFELKEPAPSMESSSDNESDNQGQVFPSESPELFESTFHRQLPSSQQHNSRPISNSNSSLLNSSDTLNISEFPSPIRVSEYSPIKNITTPSSAPASTTPASSHIPPGQSAFLTEELYNQVEQFGSFFSNPLPEEYMSLPEPNLLGGDNDYSPTLGQLSTQPENSFSSQPSSDSSFNIFSSLGDSFNDSNINGDDKADHHHHHQKSNSNEHEPTVITNNPSDDGGKPESTNTSDDPYASIFEGVDDDTVVEINDVSFEDREMATNNSSPETNENNTKTRDSSDNHVGLSSSYSQNSQTGLSGDFSDVLDIDFDDSAINQLNQNLNHQENESMVNPNVDLTEPIPSSVPLSKALQPGVISSESSQNEESSSDENDESSEDDDDDIEPIEVPHSFKKQATEELADQLISLCSKEVRYHSYLEIDQFAQWCRENGLEWALPEQYRSDYDEEEEIEVEVEEDDD